MLKAGDVAYFERASDRPAKFPGSYKFPGWGFGVVLGCVPPGYPPPPASHLFRIMGNSGFVSLDDVIEILGPELGEKFISGFEVKYYGITSQQAAKSQDADPSKLVGVDGKPFNRLTTKRLEIVSQLPEQKQ